MPYKDKKQQLEYQREWVRKRREEWFYLNGPCVKCNSWESLELDHVDPTTKKHPGDHTIWSYCKEKRLKELAKCQVLCEECHKEKTLSQRNPPRHGTVHMYTKYKCRCNDCKIAKMIDKKKYDY